MRLMLKNGATETEFLAKLGFSSRYALSFFMSQE